MKWQWASRAWLALCGLLGCAGNFHDTTVGGVPNLSSPCARVWGMGQPPDASAWNYARGVIAPHGERVIVLKLDDAVEGDDSYATSFPGWTVLDKHMPPEDDKPWTVLELPSKTIVNEALDAAVDAYSKGYVVVFHCVHGRDRTRFMIALFMRRVFKWTKEQGWNYMLDHGFRWELPDLDLYWAES